jgi:hypothetical protein
MFYVNTCKQLYIKLFFTLSSAGFLHFLFASIAGGEPGMSSNARSLVILGYVDFRLELIDQDFVQK